MHQQECAGARAGRATHRPTRASHAALKFPIQSCGTRRPVGTVCMSGELAALLPALACPLLRLGVLARAAAVVVNMRADGCIMSSAADGARLTA